MFISYCHKIPFDSILGKSSKSKIMLHVRAAHPTVIYNKVKSTMSQNRGMIK